MKERRLGTRKGQGTCLKVGRTLGASLIVVSVCGITMSSTGAFAATRKSSNTALVTGGFMTVSQAAKLGIHPNQSTNGYVVSTPKVERVVSDSASGCNQAVCISLVGSGLIVSNWSTTGVFAIQTPAFAIYYKNGSVIATSVIVEAEPGDTLFDQMIGSHSFANGTQLCNGWGGTLGHPCETVEG